VRLCRARCSRGVGDDHGVSWTRTAFLSRLGNKGAVALRMRLGPCTLCMIAVHLPAGTSAAATAARDEAPAWQALTFAFATLV